MIPGSASAGNREPVVWLEIGRIALMNRLPLFLMLLLSILINPVAVVRAAVTDKDSQSVASCNNSFALQIYEKLRNQEGNLVFSPYGISSSLSLAYAGSGGTTKVQIEDLFHLTITGDQFHRVFGDLNDSLVSGAKSRGYDLKIVNSLWHAKGSDIRRDYITVVEKCYRGSIHSVSFERDLESARRLINSWFERQSKGKFKELLADGVLTPQTRMVLGNTIYFNGVWRSKFDKRDTEKAPFTLIDGKQVVVPMMRQAGKFNYKESDTFQALELPYKTSRLSMIVLLPKERDGLANIENTLSKKNIDEWMNGMSKQELDIDLPKFKFFSKLALVEPLKSLGLTEPFSVNSADFSGIDGEGKLFISDIVQEAMVEVSEKGTEASAATSAVAETKSMRSAIAFRADHPFIFLIRQTDPTAILFLGRLVNPKDQ
ncbi:MAG: serpin family protein [Desulfomonilaceae bacterium]